ncbi:MAG: hypothetical protein IPG42_15770 [Betaproteobacteria bacterium]|jgi:hypothetical protein|nr:hypothetical protein [Betaproteobacteria bacterium]MBK7654161.1 hypothetical protein [Betaproteobacteria bacterium]MBP6645136.1 hypothetical protein [Burkholderiaceae bacterium]
MSLQYVTVPDRLPENKMRLYATKVVNIIGGPGCEKSMVSAAIILHMYLRNQSVETVPDYAKTLVWQQRNEGLKNQYQLAQRQFDMINTLDGQVKFLVNECALPQLLFYNENYEHNVCDVEKTRKQILAWYHQHQNINIVVKRSDKKYVHTGRFQTEEEAHEIDRKMRELLVREGIKYTEIEPNVQAIHHFATQIIEGHGVDNPVEE